MPVLVRLQFCVIAMYFDDHNPPHFHVLGRDGQEAEVLIRDLAVKKGSVDRRALREAIEWAKLNRTLLEEAWDDYHKP